MLVLGAAVTDCSIEIRYLSSRLESTVYRLYGRGTTNRRERRSADIGFDALEGAAQK